MKNHRVLFAACLLSWAVVSLSAEAADFSIDDALRTQRLADVQTSKQNDLVAVTFSRPSLPGDNYRRFTEFEAHVPLRDDLRVIAADDGHTVFADEGAADGGTAFAPRWSPDGKRLAYLHATRRGDYSLVVWDSTSGRRSVLVSKGVRPTAPIIRSGRGEEHGGPFAWISSNELLITRDGDVEARAQDDPDRAAAQASVGAYSGRIWRVTRTPLCRPEDEILAIRIDGTTTTILHGAIVSASVSANGEAVVIATATAQLAPPRDRALRYPPHYVADDYAPFVRWKASAYLRKAGRWTAVGAAIDGQGPILDATMPRWSADGRKWATLQMEDPFDGLRRTNVAEVAMAGARSATRAFENRTQAIGALAAFAGDDMATGASGQPLATRISAETQSVIGGELSPLGQTASAGRIIRSVRGYVTSLWIASGARTQKLFELNPHLASYSIGEPVAVSYRIDGEDRTGWLYLPAGAGAHPPVLMIAYPSSNPVLRKLSLPGQEVAHALLAKGVAVFKADFRLPEPGQPYSEPAVRIQSEIGAAVRALQASGRVDPDRLAFFGHSFGGYTALTLLAHTTYFRTIAVAAPLGDLTSYSFEGSRFFDQRCGAAQIIVKQMSHEDTGAPELVGYHTNMIMRMGNPPYLDREKYARGSPLNELGNASTPALIIQGGDDDFNDGERLYNTLYRMGVDAELLYYWGENHSIAGPENVRDMVERAVSWMMEHLAEGESGARNAPAGSASAPN
ncbi:MAG: prolyl oligopeptidase family serine peptidase [Gammaproteobacteria bacterium]